MPEDVNVIWNRASGWQSVTIPKRAPVTPRPSGVTSKHMLWPLLVKPQYVPAGASAAGGGGGGGGGAGGAGGAGGGAGSAGRPLTRSPELETGSPAPARAVALPGLRLTVPAPGPPTSTL